MKLVNAFQCATDLIVRKTKTFLIRCRRLECFTDFSLQDLNIFREIRPNVKKLEWRKFVVKEFQKNIFHVSVLDCRQLYGYKNLWVSFGILCHSLYTLLKRKFTNCARHICNKLKICIFGQFRNYLTEVQYKIDNRRNRLWKRRKLRTFPAFMCLI